MELENLEKYNFADENHLKKLLLTIPPKTLQVTTREPPISNGPTSAPRTKPWCFSTIIGVEGGTEKNNVTENCEPSNVENSFV